MKCMENTILFILKMFWASLLWSKIQSEALGSVKNQSQLLNTQIMYVFFTLNLILEMLKYNFLPSLEIFPGFRTRADGLG